MSDEDKQWLKEYQRNYRRSREATQKKICIFFNILNEKRTSLQTQE